MASSSVAGHGGLVVSRPAWAGHHHDERERPGWTAISRRDEAEVRPLTFMKPMSGVNVGVPRAPLPTTTVQEDQVFAALLLSRCGRAPVGEGKRHGGGTAYLVLSGEPGRTLGTDR